MFNRSSRINKLAKRLRSPSISLTIDLLVILSLALNAYSLYEASRMDGTLNRMNLMLDLMNKTIEHNAQELDSHIKSTYPDILAAHMEAVSGTHTITDTTASCTQP